MTSGKLKLQITLKGSDAQKFMKWYEASGHGKPGYAAREILKYGLRVKEAVSDR
jgi:hypothetical protein